jgi:hypothetical protein
MSFLVNTLFFATLANVFQTPNRNSEPEAQEDQPLVGIELAATWGRERVQSHG